MLAREHLAPRRRRCWLGRWGSCSTGRNCLWTCCSLTQHCRGRGQSPRVPEGNQRSTATPDCTRSEAGEASHSETLKTFFQKIVFNKIKYKLTFTRICQFRHGPGLVGLTAGSSKRVEFIVGLECFPLGWTFKTEKDNIYFPSSASSPSTHS